MIIGISGKLGSGKDTIGEIIQYLACLEKDALAPHQKEFKNFHLAPGSNMMQSGYEIKKFAGKLKQIAALLIGCTREQLEDREFKEKELGEEWWYCVADDGSYVPYEQNLHENKVVNIVKLTPRKILQLLGTECGREIIHPQIWVNALFADYHCIYCGETPCSEFHNNVKGGSRKEPKWIITDVRFPNEAQAIKDRGGIVIRVERPRYCDGCTLKNLETQDCKDCIVYQDDYHNQHLSETALDDYEFDHVIDNNGSIEELIEKVKSLNL